MIIYCMSDIHGFIDEFKDNISIIKSDLYKDNCKLLLLGDYIHGGIGNYEVCHTIIKLQEELGTDNVIALLGNHERWCLEGKMQIEESSLYNDKIENLILDWFSELPLYYLIENNIFVHAGIDEEAGDLWEWGTNDYYFTDKYPADIGKIDGLDKMIIAGHIGTGDIAQDDSFDEIYFDGCNHYYIDGSVYKFHNIPILMIDTEKRRYYQKRKDTCMEILPYDDI